MLQQLNDRTLQMIGFPLQRFYDVGLDEFVTDARSLTYAVVDAFCELKQHEDFIAGGSDSCDLIHSIL